MREPHKTDNRPPIKRSITLPIEVDGRIVEVEPISREIDTVEIDEEPSEDRY